MNEINIDQLEKVIGGTMISLHRFPGKTEAIGRATPSRLGPRLVELKHGTSITVIGTMENEDMDWCKVRINSTGKIVWVSAYYVD